MSTANITPSFSQLVAKAEEPDGLSLMEALIGDALHAKASDIHLDPLMKTYRIRLRIDGVLADAFMVEKETGEQMARAFEVASGMDSMSPRLPLDGHMTTEADHGACELRVASAPGVLGRKITVRILSNDALQFDLSNIGLSGHRAEEAIREVIASGNGLTLVSGPTGSGKTTTAYALLNELLQRGANLVTLEDPVEYQLEGATQIEVDAESGLTFADGIRSLLRHDPDALFLGEIRDTRSATNAVDASFSGHAVISTVHARHCVSTVTMLRAMGVADHMLAAALRLIINQRLVRRLCSDCRDQRSLTTREEDWMSAANLTPPKNLSVAVGCPACTQTGYKGRQPIFSVWKIDDQAYDSILAGVDDRALAELRSQNEQTSLAQAGMALLEKGEIDLVSLKTLL